MREQNIPWAESYPGELYPINQKKLNSNSTNHEELDILISKYKGQN